MFTEFEERDEVLFRSYGPEEWGPDPDDDGSGPDHEPSGDEDGDGGASVQNTNINGTEGSAISQGC